MLIREFSASPTPDAEKLMAISQFLIGRSDDTASKKSVSVNTFLNLAQAQGISLTVDQLKNMIQQPPLNNLIADVTGDSDTGKVIFKGADSEETPTMSVDQAQQTVDQMAKRATRKGI